MTIKKVTFRTIRELIKMEQKDLLIVKGNWSLQDVINAQAPIYGKNLDDAPGIVFERLKNEKDPYIGTHDIKCEICDKMFNLDEVFVKIEFDRDRNWDIDISIHPKCMEKIIKVDDIMADLGVLFK